MNKYRVVLAEPNGVYSRVYIDADTIDVTAGGAVIFRELVGVERTRIVRAIAPGWWSGVEFVGRDSV